MKENKPKILWVSLMAPYDKVKHAGGKIENFYLKNLFKGGKFDIHLISFANDSIKDELDLDAYGISNSILYYTWTGLDGKRNKLSNAFGKMNIYGRGAGLTATFYSKHALAEMKRMKETGYEPDIIILQWTEIAVIMEMAKNLYPKAKIVMIEEDVSFLGHGRKAEAATGVKRLLLKAKAVRIKSRELELLNRADLIILNNHKDEKLIENEVSDKKKIWVWCPYYQTLLDRPRKKHNKDILFYGALSREENWKSVVWFLEKVWADIDDLDARFVIIGSNPPEVLKKYESDRVIITGFVDEIHPYFEKSLCLAAPLVLGAGVKIKVLEGLSSGIPVLTNKIGIEGIPAVDGQDYFFCETPEQYREHIQMLLDDKVKWNNIEKNSKAFIENNFDFQADILNFEKKLIGLL